MAQDADKPEIKIGYVNGWADSVASSETAAAIIREKLHYPVKLVAVSAGIMWSGVARGDLDASLSAWLPVTHKQYYKKRSEEQTSELQSLMRISSAVFCLQKTNIKTIKHI